MGDPRHPGTDPPHVTLSGVVFPLDEVVELDGREHHALLSLLGGNDHFYVSDLSAELVRSMWQASDDRTQASPYAGADRGTPSRSP